MKRNLALIIVAVGLANPLAHSEANKPWDGSYYGFKGRYLLYSGDLGEQQPPTRVDRKASFMVEGTIAKELFEAIGPDLKDACGSLSGLRVRHKRDLDCTYDKEHPAAPYTCRFGLDLRTGKSIAGSIC